MFIVHRLQGMSLGLGARRFRCLRTGAPGGGIPGLACFFLQHHHLFTDIACLPHSKVKQQDTVAQSNPSPSNRLHEAMNSVNCIQILRFYSVLPGLH
jgi:hypothetical protein